MSLYNITDGTGNLTSCSDITCWLTWVNTNSTFTDLNIQVFATMIVLGAFVLSFIVANRFSPEVAFLSSAFFGFMVSVLLSLAGLLNPIVVVMMLLALGLAVVTK